MRKTKISSLNPKHFELSVDGPVATVTLSRPERKNPLTFDSYMELVNFFRTIKYVSEIKTIIVTGAGGNFSSGGDVHEIISPLVGMDMVGVYDFTQMTGDLVKAMRDCPQPIVSAIEGICAGAGAIIAMSSDLRIGTEESKVAFLFVRVGLAGCDMGACAILPRIIGQGRASELLYTGRSLGGRQAFDWGFFNQLAPSREALSTARKVAADLCAGPTFAHGLTKKMLHQEWSMSIEQAIESEALAQAVAMRTEDFSRAYRAFAAKQKPIFEGN